MRVGFQTGRLRWLTCLVALLGILVWSFGGAVASHVAADAGSARVANWHDYEGTAPSMLATSAPLVLRGPGSATFAGSRAETVSLAHAGVAAKTETSLGSKLAESCLNSFTGTTLVLMADGTKKPIKAPSSATGVMAKNPVTGEQHPEQVIRLIRHSGPHTMVAVRLAHGSTVDATDHHAFWVASRGAWVDAIDLRGGDVVETANGQRIAVASVGIRAEDLTAYNLTVENVHTYYAGDDAVLVHNAGCDPRDLRGLSDSYVKRLLKQFDTEPHAFKEEYVGRGAVPRFDIKMGPDGELHLVNKDGSIVIPTGVFPE